MIGCPSLELNTFIADKALWLVLSENTFNWQGGEKGENQTSVAILIKTI